MHKVRVKGILSSKNGMNIYRGCSHGCIYCDSRSVCYDFKHDFEDIEVKENAPELLEMSLMKKRKKCMIGTGSMCDPYLHLENELRLTRKCLSIIAKYKFGVSILTKSTDILQDLDLLLEIHRSAKCVVQITLTTFNDELCKIIEPNVSLTSERIKALNIFKKAGIPTVVWLCPILPFINDTEENLIALLSACKEANVKGIINFGFGLTLREGNRDYFYKQLDKHFVGMKEKYQKTFGLSYECNSPNQNKLMKIFTNFCRENNILYRLEDVFNYLNDLEERKEFEQLKLF